MLRMRATQACAPQRSSGLRWAHPSAPPSARLSAPAGVTPHNHSRVTLNCPPTNVTRSRAIRERSQGKGQGECRLYAPYACDSSMRSAHRRGRGCRLLGRLGAGRACGVGRGHLPHGSWYCTALQLRCNAVRHCWRYVVFRCSTLYFVAPPDGSDTKPEPPTIEPS